MEYNPFTHEYDRIRGLIKQKKSENNKLIAEKRWFDNTNISELFSSLEQMEKLKNNYEMLTVNIGKEAAILSASLQEIEKHTGTLFNPFNWFDDEQKKFRTKCNNLKEKLRTRQEDKEKN